MTDIIEYESDNGFKGVIYGKSSLVIYDKDGVKRFHTGFRNAQTLKELIEIVEGFPKFLEVLYDRDHNIE